MKGGDTMNERERERARAAVSLAIRRYFPEVLTRELYGNLYETAEEELADTVKRLECADSLILHLIELNDLLTDELVAVQVELDSLKRDRTAAGDPENEANE